jgi:type II secretory pathway component PulM
LKLAAKRLAEETGFSAAEIQSMPFAEMVWWLSD